MNNNALNLTKSEIMKVTKIMNNERVAAVVFIFRKYVIGNFKVKIKCEEAKDIPSVLAKPNENISSVQLS